MTLTEKNFTVATTFTCNEQATTYRWVLQQIKHLYFFTSSMSNGQDEVEYQRKLEVLKTRWRSRSDSLHYLFNTWLNPFAHKFYRVWTSQVLCFGVEITNRVESEHPMLKLWLSTCHGDLDTVFLNIDFLIQGQIAEIKYTLEISKLKEKYDAKSNPIVKNLSNKISHLGLKKIMDELKKARQMVEEPGSNFLHYLGKSHGLPCACEFVNRCQYFISIQEEGVDIFWKKLEIGSDIPEEHNRDIESEMRDLTSLLQEISDSSKVLYIRYCLMILVSRCQTPQETAVTNRRWKTNFTKRDKSHWEYVSIAHRKIGKSSGSGSGFGSALGSGSNPSPHGRGRPPRSGRGRGRGRTSGRSSLSSVVNSDSPSVSFPFNNAFPWVVSNFLFGDENHWVEIRRRMGYDLRHRMNVYEQLFGSVEHVTKLIKKTN
ncbi:hypothetical protein M9H77_06488 [Catharanthus roseus]|uniref:Uncharacterized protein n=1 Tax=Catharanthus roseus TaxID=4058 RepID=A0ACC0BSN2_CATRO|nr:hypothetical protein M9H77_06488 [Catharanthus roseus]